jgi:hypothetical protein
LFGAANPKRLLREVKQKGYETPSLKYLTDLIENQATAQQFRRVNPRRLFVPIVGKEYQYQADLMFFDRGSQKIPLLVMIELTSRKANGRIMPNKKAFTTAAALESILESIEKEGHHCNSIEHDDGSEFKREFAVLLASKHIQSIVFPRGEESKTALGKINIFVRTIRTLMEKADKNRGGNWRTNFPALVELYNSNVSHATGLAQNNG